MPCILSNLPFIDEHGIDAPYHLGQGIAFPLDPEVHGVERYERGAMHLLQNVELQGGVDIAQEHMGSIPIVRRQRGVKALEDIQTGIESVSHIHVVVVLANPAKRLAGSLLQPSEINPALAQEVDARSW